MRWPFSNSFSHAQQVRRTIGVALLIVTAVMYVGGAIFWEYLVTNRKIFAWYWSIVFFGVCVAIALALWDFLDVMLHSVGEREKMRHEHFSDPEFIREIREAKAKELAPKKHDNEEPTS